MCCLMKIQKPWVDTGCSQHQNFKHTDLCVLKFNLEYIKLKANYSFLITWVTQYEYHNEKIHVIYGLFGLHNPNLGSSLRCP